LGTSAVGETVHNVLYYSGLIYSSCDVTCTNTYVSDTTYE